MSMSCGIDLHSTTSREAVLNDQVEVVREKGPGNPLEDMLRSLEPSVRSMGSGTALGAVE